MTRLEYILQKDTLSRDDLIFLLSIEDKDELQKIYKKAYDIKKEYVGTKVYFRGIIEFSNICVKNCNYCGIRKDNKDVERYLMSEDEIVRAAKWAYDADYGSIVMQSGERIDEDFVCLVENVLNKIKAETDNELGVTLSLGEQTKETFQRWYNAGAHRYLLRIETTNPKLYQSLHPEDHSFEERLESIKNLRETGYQVGTGVMIGLPGQTFEDLADDIIFFKEQDIDMIGMGPYIPHVGTPMAQSIPGFDEKRDQQLELGLKMIAVTRIFLKDVNIASTTALQALKSVGREMGLMAGANIIMPNITETKYRAGYQLYDNKPCLDENSEMCKGCLGRRVTSIGETIGFKEWGDSPHFKKRVGE